MSITALIFSFLFILFILFKFLKRRIISPSSFFFIGCFFYFIIPIIIGENFDILGSTFFDGWYGYYNQVSQDDKLFVLLFSFLLCISFFSAEYLFEKKVNMITPKVSSSFIYIHPVSILALAIWYLGKDYYFKGYSGIEYDSEVMGKLATLQVLVLYFLMVSKGSMKTFSFYFFILLINSILLLSMGGRMYIILTIFSIVSFYFSGEKIPIKVMLSIALAITILVLVGMWRLDGIKDGLFLYILFAEPIFTSFSLLTYVSQNEILLFNIPWNFLNSFIMSLPSFVIDKNEYLIRVEDMGAVFDSPLGATSLLVSLLVNFGFIGSMLFIFIFSGILSIAKSSRVSYFRCFYYVSCGVIPFMLFRDPFGISVKVIFFTGLFIPFLIYLFDHILLKASNYE